jgi:hypothetical protein
MPDDLFSILDNLAMATDIQKRRLRSKLESKVDEWQRSEQKAIEEGIKWDAIRTRQLREDIEREEHDRLAKEAFERESLEIITRRQKKVFMARRAAKRRKHKLIKIKKELKAIRARRKKRDAKSDAELIIEISTKESPEALRKWLYRNLSVALAPRKSDDPDWDKKNKILQEIIECRNDLKKLKEIAELHKPEWAYFFKC